MRKDGGDYVKIGVRDGNYLNWQRQENSLCTGNSWKKWKEERI